MARVGLGLGLAKPARRVFRQAVRRGQLPSFFESRPEERALFEEAMNAEGRRGRRATRFAERGGFTPTTTQFGPPPVPGDTPPTGTSGPGPTGPAAPPTFGDIAERFTINTPPEYDILTKLASGTAARTGSMDLPTYDEMFRRWTEVGEREADRNAAKINDAFGSRGARYSSDLLDAQGDLRKQLFQDQMKYSTEAQLGLNQQRLSELGGAANVLSGVGASRANIAMGGAERAILDYLRGTSPNPLLEAMLGYATSFDTPGQVVY